MIGALALIVSAAAGAGGVVDLREPDCSQSGAVAAFPRLRELQDGCDAGFESPDGKWTIRFENGRGEPWLTGAKGDSKTTSGDGVQGPATLAWSPASDTFIVNDGEGSGQDSVLHVYRAEARGLTQATLFQENALKTFRQLNGCASDAVPGVWGLGFDDDGLILHALVQAHRDGECGYREGYVIVSMLVATGETVSVVREPDAGQAFAAFLPGRR